MGQDIITHKNAVDIIKTAILQSQARAAKAVNQEQLALYYGIGRYISANTRNHGWGTGVLKQISDSLRLELPGLRGFSETNLKNMRLFYEAWKSIESNSSVLTDELDTSLSCHQKKNCKRCLWRVVKRRIKITMSPVPIKVPSISRITGKC